jgi:hypothetical protein
MTVEFRSPLVDHFRRGDAPRDARLLAARGLLTRQTHEQLVLLALLAEDPDPEVKALANATIDRLPREALVAFLGGAEVEPGLRAFYVNRRALDVSTAAAAATALETARAPEAVEAAKAAEAAETAEADSDDGVEEPSSEEESSESDGPDAPKVLANLPVGDKLKLAVKGTREQRAQLIRDSNKLVATAVLTSPKLTEAEVEAFVKMGNVSEDVLRIIGTNRTWVKNYSVILGLARNPKTPPAMSMQMLNRLSPKDVKMLAVDRNVPESLRLAARRLSAKARLQ